MGASVTVDGYEELEGSADHCADVQPMKHKLMGLNVYSYTG